MTVSFESCGFSAKPCARFIPSSCPPPLWFPSSESRPRTRFFPRPPAPISPSLHVQLFSRRFLLLLDSFLPPLLRFRAFPFLSVALIRCSDVFAHAISNPLSCSPKRSLLSCFHSCFIQVPSRSVARGFIYAPNSSLIHAWFAGASVLSLYQMTIACPQLLFSGSVFLNQDIHVLTVEDATFPF